MSMRRIVVAAVVWFGLLIFVQPAVAAGRFALLIGQSGYPGAPGAAGVWARLPNAVNDVRLIAKTLRQVGFKVEVVENGTYDQIGAAVDRFAASASDADAAVFYYSGHGFEYDRRNYLVPVDAPVSVTLTDLPSMFVFVDAFVNAAAGQSAKVNIFFLDACRTGAPFVKVDNAGQILESLTKIEDVQYPEGAALAIVYSTSRGKPALDSAPPPAEYSPFAYALAQDMQIPLIDFGLMVENLRRDVSLRTKGMKTQWPYWDSSLEPGFFFNPTAISQPVAAPGSLQAVDH